MMHVQNIFFLLCNKDVGALKFDYYKKDFGHLIDKSLFSIFENYNHNVFFLIEI